MSAMQRIFSDDPVMVTAAPKGAPTPSPRAPEPTPGPEPVDPAPPKATATPDSRFPAWLIDTVIASAVADQLAQGLATALGLTTLVRAFRHWTRTVFLGSRPPRADVTAWLVRAERATPAVAPVIGRAFRAAHAEGWLAGVESAEAVLDAARGGWDVREPGHVDVPQWSWRIGDHDAARMALEALDDDRGVRRLYADAAPYMRSAVHHTMARLAGVLVDGMNEGRSVEEITAELRTVLEDPVRARNIAQTEVSRAVSAATLETYRRDEVPAKEWMTAFDQRVCDICKGNESTGPIALDGEFPSGDTHPPAHPGGCRCGLLPAYRDRH
jgi:SPP1 gp7 family putative phage head morphogenesis protein